MSLDFSLDLCSLRAAYASGTRIRDVIAEIYRRIEAANDPGIFLHLRPEDDVLADGDRLGTHDSSLPLWGVPFAIKDNIDLAGAPTTAGCPDFAYQAQEDAFVVAQLKAAGAILIGKTNLDQFATGLVGVRTPYPVPRNALDPEIIPGGSSSGSAVAVAQGIVSFALGTDTAGSGRVPAALNNIVGLKPTLGALSNTGVVPACRTLDTVSIFALTVPDAHTVFQAAATYDPGDAYARPIAAPDLVAPPPALTIGVPNLASRLFFGDSVQEAAFESAIDQLRTFGCSVSKIDFRPLFDIAHMLYEGAWVAERMTVIEEMYARSPQALHPVTRKIIGAAEGLTAADAFRGMYRLAELKRTAEPALTSVDLLCVPTIPTFYSVADLAADPVMPNARLGTYTNFVNLMDLCGLAVPHGTRSDGRPASVTFLAKAGRDGLIAALGAQLHAASDGTLGATNNPLPATDKQPAEPQPDEMAIAVVGAHMSGLPLNAELTSRGGRFLEATSTSASYRFYALAGGPPFRPGLVRTEAGGAAILLEVWALPKSAVGDFLAEIPAPLTIGTIELADGRLVKGFLAESYETTNAREITRFGGWRKFLNVGDQVPLN